MARVEQMNGALLFECPGCPVDHAINIDPTKEGPCWEWDGDVNRPTLSPSIMATYPWRTLPNGTREQIVCHSFVRDGNIQFLDDCTHGLKGRTVELYDIEDDDERQGRIEHKYPD